MFDEYGNFYGGRRSGGMSYLALLVFFIFMVLMFAGVFRGNNDEYYGIPTPTSYIVEYNWG